MKTVSLDVVGADEAVITVAYLTIPHSFLLFY